MKLSGKDLQSFFFTVASPYAVDLNHSQSLSSRFPTACQISACQLRYVTDPRLKPHDWSEQTLRTKKVPVQTELSPSPIRLQIEISSLICETAKPINKCSLGSQQASQTDSWQSKYCSGQILLSTVRSVECGLLAILAQGCFLWG